VSSERNSYESFTPGTRAASRNSEEKGFGKRNCSAESPESDMHDCFRARARWGKSKKWERGKKGTDHFY